MFDWPHSPPHRFANDGTYFITAGTYLKRHHFRCAEDLNRLMALLFALSNEYQLSLQAWCLFSNHYHLVAQGAGESLRLMLSKFHSTSSRELNARDQEVGRKVWFQFRDTELTYERSWLARLKYTHTNAVKHGLVTDAVNYPWCSAAWFERVSSPAFCRTIQQLRLDRIRIFDEYDVENPFE